MASWSEEQEGFQKGQDRETWMHSLLALHLSASQLLQL